MQIRQQFLDAASRPCPARQPPKAPTPAAPPACYSLVHKLIDYGTLLAATLRQHGLGDDSAMQGRPFGTTNVTLILARSSPLAGTRADHHARAWPLRRPVHRHRETAVPVANSRRPVRGTTAGPVATLASEIAHQVHGAIGFTNEYSLQLSTRRLWSWRDEFGGDTDWAAKVGAYICARGADRLWPTFTDC